MKQRWYILDKELANLKACKADDEFVVYPPDQEYGVIVYRTGEISNRYEDGTVGVLHKHWEAARNEDELYSLDDLDAIGCWYDVEEITTGHVLLE